MGFLTLISQSKLLREMLFLVVLGGGAIFLFTQYTGRIVEEAENRARLQDNLATTEASLATQRIEAKRLIQERKQINQALAALANTEQELRSQHRATLRTVEALKDEVAEVKAWADARMPDDIVVLLIDTANANGGSDQDRESRDSKTFTF